MLGRVKAKTGKRKQRDCMGQCHMALAWKKNISISELVYSEIGTIKIDFYM